MSSPPRLVSRRVASPALLLLAATAAAQERATGSVTVPVAPPEPRGALVETPGGGPPVLVPRGGSVRVEGANVVTERETPRGTTLTMQNDVLFDFDQAELRPGAAEALGRVVEIIRQRAPRAVLVVGHTDALGTAAYNLALSRRRAEAVLAWLNAHGGGGLPALRAAGRGEAEPVAPNAEAGRDNPAGRQRNRRVEVLLER